MVDAMGDGTSVPTELIPRCPHCGAEAFPWVRGYGNFLQGVKYEGEYQKVSDYVEKHLNDNILYLELGIGARNQMIKAPLMKMVAEHPSWHYVTLNMPGEIYIPAQIADRSLAVPGNIANSFTSIKEMH